MIGVSTISSGRITEYTKKPRLTSICLQFWPVQMICRRCLLTNLFCRTTYRNSNSLLHTFKAKATSLWLLQVLSPIHKFYNHNRDNPFSLTQEQEEHTITVPQR